MYVSAEGISQWDFHLSPLLNFYSLFIFFSISENSEKLRNCGIPFQEEHFSINSFMVPHPFEVDLKQNDFGLVPTAGKLFLFLVRVHHRMKVFFLSGPRQHHIFSRFLFRLVENVKNCEKWKNNKTPKAFEFQITSIQCTTQSKFRYIWKNSERSAKKTFSPRHRTSVWNAQKSVCMFCVLTKITTFAPATNHLISIRRLSCETNFNLLSFRHVNYVCLIFCVFGFFSTEQALISGVSDVAPSKNSNNALSDETCWNNIDAH